MDINLIAPINPLGYGVVGYNVLKALDAEGDNVAMFPIGDPKWANTEQAQQLLKKTIENSHYYSSTAPSIRIWHQFALDMFPGNGPRIGWPIFELDKFNDKEKHHLRSVDALIVCSEWAKEVIKNNGIDTPTFVVPLGVDPDIFFSNEQEKKDRPSWTKDSTVFLNIGKWERRKGHEELIDAFCKAFKDTDNVELWMINDNPFIGDKNLVWKKRYVNSPMGRNVKFFDRFEKHEHLAKIFNHVDCGVFPAHAEGWNLEIPELMACGAHIIATNYSGHTAFLTEENSFRIDPTGMEAAIEKPWFYGQGDWCTFDVDQLVEHMREVHKRKQEGTLGVNTAGIETAKALTWKNTADKIFQTIEGMRSWTVTNEANV